jgi:hydrogenase-4 component F
LFAFFGLTRLVFAIVDGRPRASLRSRGRRFPETAGVIVPPLLLLALALWLGLFTPAVLRQAWSSAIPQLFPAS